MIIRAPRDHCCIHGCWRRPTQNLQLDDIVWPLCDEHVAEVKRLMQPAIDRWAHHIAAGGSLETLPEYGAHNGSRRLRSRLQPWPIAGRAAPKATTDV